MNRVNHTFSSIQQVTDQFLTTKNQKNLEKSCRDFVCRDIKRKTGIEVSKHAAMRLENRNINLTDQQNNQLGSKIKKRVKRGSMSH